MIPSKMACLTKLLSSTQFFIHFLPFCFFCDFHLFVTLFCMRLWVLCIQLLSRRRRPFEPLAGTTRQTVLQPAQTWRQGSEPNRPNFASVHTTTCSQEDPVPAHVWRFRSIIRPFLSSIPLAASFAFLLVQG